MFMPNWIHWHRSNLFRLAFIKLTVDYALVVLLLYYFLLEGSYHIIAQAYVRV